MNRIKYILIIVHLSLWIGCHKKPAYVLSPDIVVQTPYGNIKIHLYEEMKVYKSAILQSLQQKNNIEAKIQSCAPERFIHIEHHTKNDTATILPPSFSKKRSMKYGTLAMFRGGLEENPMMYSRPSQWMLITGKRKYRNERLDHLEETINNSIFTMWAVQMIHQNPKWDLSLEDLMSYMENTSKEFPDINNRWIHHFNKFHYSAKAREIYNTIGGLPDLDMQYTIVGEVVEGWDALDKLGQIPIDDNYEPFSSPILTISKTKR